MKFWRSNTWNKSDFKVANISVLPSYHIQMEMKSDSLLRSIKYVHTLRGEGVPEKAGWCVQGEEGGYLGHCTHFIPIWAPNWWVLKLKFLWKNVSFQLPSTNGAISFHVFLQNFPFIHFLLCIKGASIKYIWLRGGGYQKMANCGVR